MNDEIVLRLKKVVLKTETFDIQNFPHCRLLDIPSYRSLSSVRFNYKPGYKPCDLL